MHSQTQTMSELVHEAYQASVRKSKTTLELLQNFYRFLQKNRVKVRKDDEKRLGEFIESINVEGFDNKEEI